MVLKLGERGFTQLLRMFPLLLREFKICSLGSISIRAGEGWGLVWFLQTGLVYDQV